MQAVREQSIAIALDNTDQVYYFCLRFMCGVIIRNAI
jgi:hypothetical protein